MAKRNRSVASCSAPLRYVSRTEIACTPPQCGHLTFSVDFQDARRLCTSISMPVGACRLVFGTNEEKWGHGECGPFCRVRSGQYWTLLGTSRGAAR
jgi:hypothetical protein